MPDPVSVTNSSSDLTPSKFNDFDPVQKPSLTESKETWQQQTINADNRIGNDCVISIKEDSAPAGTQQCGSCLRLGFFRCSSVVAYALAYGLWCILALLFAFGGCPPGILPSNWGNANNNNGDGEGGGGDGDGDGGGGGD